MNRKRQELSLHNSSQQPLTLHLEPWGEQFPMPPNCTFQAVAEGPDSKHSLQVEFNGSDVTVYSWPGSTVVLSQDGRRLESGAAEIPSPLRL